MRTSILAFTLAAVGAGCAVEADETLLAVGRADAPLYAKSFRLFPAPRIPVCWFEPGYTTEKEWVRDAIVSSWGRHSRLTFYGWIDTCPTSGNYIRVIPTGEFVTHSAIAPTSVLRPDVNLNFIDAVPASRRCVNTAENREQCIRNSSIHEFGHAIGFVHEQEHPNAPAENGCSASAGWRAGTSDLMPAPGGYDADSIMNYCNGAPDVPSAGDYTGIIDLYGPESGISLQQRSGTRCIGPAAGGGTNPSEGLPAIFRNCTGGTELLHELDSIGWLAQTASNMVLQPETTTISNGTRLVYRRNADFSALFSLTVGGSLRHASGKCIHPKGGSTNASNGTELVLWDGCDEERLQFKGVIPGWVRIAHISGLCVHPEGGSSQPADGTRAVLWNNCSPAEQLQFGMRSSGSIQHMASGKCLHPRGGSQNPGNNAEWVFWSGCDEDRLKFELTPRGSLRHVASGRCIHPLGGSGLPAEGTPLVFHDGCNQEQLRFTPVTF